MERNADQSRDFSHGIEGGQPERHPHRPTPDLFTGQLTVDPEIVLRAKAFNLNISFFYSERSSDNEEYGKKRSASVKTYVVSQLAQNSGPNRAQINKGDFSKYLFDEVSGEGNGNGGPF